ncbi:zerumbone synthase-like [Nymphaea colorata]|uniref:zerumbone synthase-like n=1 Tax=Nymphaea colorata TaxID=210225 RepID=UPI00129E53DE|nr:zerumbone synthase-like [Nymphaea colorata]
MATEAETVAKDDSLSAKRLEGKVAIVTGGARGIGRTTAELFHQHGAKVIIVDVLDELGQSVCAARGDPDGFLYSQGDVTVEADVAAAVDLALARFGRLDIMVNNAGVSGGNERHDIREMELDRFRRVLAVNVDGVFLGIKHAARAMVPRRSGSIVCIGSVASTMGGFGPHPYAASKHAVLGLTRSAAADLGRHGIRVNCVSPYGVATPLAIPFSEGGDSSSSSIDGFHHYVGQFANLKGVNLTVDDVAQAVLYLAGDESKYVSGLNLVVDGGFTCVNHSFGIYKP